MSMLGLGDAIMQSASGTLAATVTVVPKFICVGDDNTTMEFREDFKASAQGDIACTVSANGTCGGEADNVNLDGEVAAATISDLYEFLEGGKGILGISWGALLTIGTVAASGTMLSFSLVLLLTFIAAVVDTGTEIGFDLSGNACPTFDVVLVLNFALACPSIESHFLKIGWGLGFGDTERSACTRSEVDE